MRNKEAISVLRKQLNKIENPENRTDLFLMETKTYIGIFFSDKSDQYSFISNFKWFEPNSFFYSDDDDKEPEKRYLKIKKFLENSIATIENMGIKKEPVVDNWFSRLPNWAINLGLPALCFISFSMGILFTNNNNSELRMENKKLKEEKLIRISDTINVSYKNTINVPLVPPK